MARAAGEYCALHGLSRKTFGWWAWRLDRQGRSAPADTAAHFLPVEIAEVPDRDAGGAVPVGEEARIEIALPDGVRGGCPGRCCKWMGVAQVDNYAASPRLARLEWSARVVARAAFRASRASLSFGNCL